MAANPGVSALMFGAAAPWALADQERARLGDCGARFGVSDRAIAAGFMTGHESRGTGSPRNPTITSGRCGCTVSTGLGDAESAVDGVGESPVQADRAATLSNMTGKMSPGHHCVLTLCVHEWFPPLSSPSQGKSDPTASTSDWWISCVSGPVFAAKAAGYPPPGRVDLMPSDASPLPAEEALLLLLVRVLAHRARLGDRR